MNNYFQNKTVIVIAHKIKSIIESDKILVIDSGEIIEYDSPFNLIKNENSYFCKLIKIMEENESFWIIY